MTRMEWLILEKTAITDKGLEHLQGMTALKTLNVNETNVTKAGLAQLCARCHFVAGGCVGV